MKRRRSTSQRSIGGWPSTTQSATALPAPPPEATYQPGEMKFSASVNAEYDLLVGPARLPGVLNRAHGPGAV